jgi:VWFA-related protein
MMRPVAGAILSTVCLGLTAQERPVFRSSADAVAVDVSVRQGRRPIGGLTAFDFEVLDNGQKQKVVDTSVEAMPVELLLLLDDSASLDAATVARVRKLPSEIEAHLTSEDRLRTFGFAGRVAALRGQLPISLPGSSPERDQTALMDAIIALVIQATDPARRRLLIVVSDGIDGSSSIEHSVRTAVLDRSDVVVDFVLVADERWQFQYTLLPWQLWQAPTERARLFRTSESGIPWVLFDIAERTGGDLLDVKPGDNFLPVLMASIDGFRKRYVLRYIPAGVPPAGWHDLKITVPGRKYEVRHRRGYWRSSGP